MRSLKKLNLGFQKMYLIYSKKQKAKILHVDAENFPGVDIVQDLSQPNSLSFCDKLKGLKLFILKFLRKCAQSS